jgi:hypothetical protein
LCCFGRSDFLADDDAGGTHVQNRFRSPYGLSTRPTYGQNLKSFSHGAGEAAWSRGHLCDQLSVAWLISPRSDRIAFA